MSSSSGSVISFELEPVEEADFEELVAIRIAAMRASLERVGRFDPVRAAERLRKSFYPRWTRLIVMAAKRIGFYALRESEGHLVLDHLYVEPKYQNLGIGSAVLKALLVEAKAKKL